MRRPLPALAVILFAMAASPSYARTAPDLSDLIGARGPGGENEMESRGYEQAGRGNYWWNEQRGTCVRMRVSNGRVSALDLMPPNTCGQGGGGGHANRGCPADVSQADRWKYPDCDRHGYNDGGYGQGGGYSGERGDNDVPQRALDACNRRTDDYMNVRPGTSTPNGATMRGDNWVLRMATGGEGKSTCTVTPDGHVLDMSPGW